jgi:hypothetical protein
MKFTYGSGQRPLDGYTIKRGVGKGGFGEVYFAVSDGGKEVALKLVRGDSDIELRGIAQCLNLKHPNLVSLFDLRADAESNQWVVMEYVAGEALHMVLNRHPQGLPLELTKQWFRELSRAVGYLHDHGIVHRDLKPANIFIENSLLKVGDYGLCKSMSMTHRSAHTQSIGTVHYMAPEIGTGNYGKQIDVYACGILLYEMLSGKVPFEGESAQEILMKHMTSSPDLSKLPFEFVPIVSKALAKDPKQRYASMAEMAQAVEGLNAPPAAKPASPAPIIPAVRPVFDSPLPSVLPVQPVSLRGQVGELSGSMAMAALIALLATLLCAAVFGDGNPILLGSLFFTTVAISWSVLVPAKFWTRPNSEGWGRRLIMMGLGALIGVGTMWLNGWTPTIKDPSNLTVSSAREFTRRMFTDSHGIALSAGYVAYYGLALGALRWWRIADRKRRQWFSLFPLIASGFWAAVLCFVWPWFEQPSYFGAAALVMSAAIVQWVSPWDAPPPPMPKRLRLKYA